MVIKYTVKTASILKLHYWSEGFIKGHICPNQTTRKKPPNKTEVNARAPKRLEEHFYYGWFAKMNVTNLLLPKLFKEGTISSKRSPSIGEAQNQTHAKTTSGFGAAGQFITRGTQKHPTVTATQTDMQIHFARRKRCHPASGSFSAHWKHYVTLTELAVTFPCRMINYKMLLLFSEGFSA